MTVFVVDGFQISQDLSLMGDNNNNKDDSTETQTDSEVGQGHFRLETSLPEIRLDPGVTEALLPRPNPPPKPANIRLKLLEYKQARSGSSEEEKYDSEIFNNNSSGVTITVRSVERDLPSRPQSKIPIYKARRHRKSDKSRQKICLKLESEDDGQRDISRGSHSRAGSASGRGTPASLIPRPCQSLSGRNTPVSRLWESDSIEVAKLNASQQIVAPLKMKNRQFLTRNLELSARNKQLESGRRNVSNSVSVGSNGQQEREKNRHRNKLETKVQIKREDYQSLSSGDYEMLYSHLLREYRELCRAHQLLQARCGKTHPQDVEREEKKLHYYQIKLEAAETKLRDFESYFNDNSDPVKKLINEKESQTLKIFHLCEKIKAMGEKEQTLQSEVQEAKDQADLLEFRVLELEECQEKEKIKTSVPDCHKKQDIGTETDSELIDSGCSSLRQSRSSSLNKEFEESQNYKSNFGNEKIYETQQKLHALMGEVRGTSSKSLLIQTVALFEALLGRIKDLQSEVESQEALRKASDDMVLEVENLNARNIGLNCRNKELESQVSSLEQELRAKNSDLSRKEETQRKLSNMQLKVEEDLKKEVSSLSQKLNSTIVGYRSESEMYEQSLLKVSILERSITSLQQSITELQRENNQLRDQLSAALEHHSNKSSGSYGSEYGTNKSGSFSNTDISEGTTHGSTSSGIWSVTSDILSDNEELCKSLPVRKESSIGINSASYIDSLRSEQSELSKKLEQAQAEIKLLRSDKSARSDEDGWRKIAPESTLEENTNYSLSKTDEHEHRNKLEHLLSDYNLLVTACYISSALNHATHGRVNDTTSDQDIVLPAIDTNREDLELEIEKLKYDQRELEISRERLVEETSRNIMILEEEVAHLHREGKFMKDQYDREISLLQKELKETRSIDLSNSAHANYLQNTIMEIEHEFENIDYINQREISLPDKIRQLLDNEAKYLEEISKNKEKEQAFRETLAEADIIMTNIENNYKTKVAELEEHNALLQQKLSLDSESESLLTQLLQSDKSDQSKILMEKLFKKEKNEMNLMDKVFDLEKTVKEISQKVCDEKILKNELDDTTKDQELNLRKIKNLETENKELLEEIMRNKEVEFKYQELQQSEGYLRGRIEELEITEISLREEFSECERRSGMRERKLVEEISKLRDEIKHINTSGLDCGKPRGCDENLKMDYDAAKERLRDLTCHLEERSKIFQDTESSLRAELSKARTSMSNTQKQLYEYDAENYQLKEKTINLEMKLKLKCEELDQLTNQLEKNNIEHSNILTEKERQISMMETQKAEDDDSSQSELSEISQREGGLQSVINDIHLVSASLSSCETCCKDTNSIKLAEAASQLEFLTRVIFHNSHQDLCSEENLLGIEMEEKLSPAREQQRIEDSLLETQLAELTTKLDRMESEMVLVSEESSNLQQALEIKDSMIVDQRQQLSELSQLVLTLERLIPHQAGTRREPRNTGLSKIKRLQESARTDDILDKREVNLTLLPPEHLQLLRRVGSDGLLVSWTPPEDDEVTGYLIYVNSEIIQKVRSASRTKALLHNLDLDTSMTITLHSINNDDEVSQEVSLQYNKDMELLVTSKKVSMNEQNNNNKTE